MNKKSIQKFLASASLVIFVSTWYFTFGVNPLGWNDALAPAARASAVSWVGSSTGNWENALNWSGGTVPTSADDVTIASTTSNITVTLSAGQTANFNSLTIGGVVSTTGALLLIGDIGTGGSINVSTSGTLTQQNANTQTITGTLTAESGSTLTHTVNPGSSSNQEYGFIFSAGGFVMQASSTLNVSSKGFWRANCGISATTDGLGLGAGSGTSEDGSGASHGGLGGNADPMNGPNAKTFVYGSISAPITYGSSGGNSHYSCGGTGGGLANITVTGGGVATVDGTISADGERASGANTAYGGGGAGGSVWLNFSSGGTFSGGGVITAKGGNGGGGNPFGDGGGGGGGGRIAITGQTGDSFAGTFTYNGGIGGSVSSPAKDGGAGTLYKKLSASTYGDLYIDNSTSTDYTATNSSSTMTIANLYLTGYANFVVTTNTVFTLTTSTLPSTNSVSSTLDIRGNLVTPSAFTIKGRNQVLTAPSSVSGLTDLTIDSNGQLIIKNLTTSSQWSLNSLNVIGQLTTPTNTVSIAHAIVIDATTLTVSSTGSIVADGRGYRGGSYGSGGAFQILAAGPGPGLYNAASSFYGGGGAYGGAGGDGHSASSTGGSAYGTTSTPDYDAGSGGGSGYQDNQVGGSGGGIIRLSGTTVTVNGTVSANGQIGANVCGGTPTSAAGGGAGGGIKISATTLSGNGIIQANGGNGGNQTSTCSGGGGGGGRILIMANNYNFVGTATTSPGIGSTWSLSTAGDGIAGTTALAPYSPTGLYTGTTTAQTGSTNPTNLATTTPVFSAIFLDPETFDSGIKAHIQVSTSSSFATITHWDSGVLGTAITTCAYNTRCQDIQYGSFGSSPTQNLSLNDDGSESATQTVYYWRIRYFDALGSNGSYSTTTATFTLADAPSAPTALVTSTVSTSSVALAWTDNSAIETSFQFQTSSDNIVYGDVASVSADIVTTTAFDLAPNYPYYFRVRAVNATGNSNYTTSSLVYTLANTPSGASAIAGTANAATVTWSANGNSTSTAYYVSVVGNPDNNSGWVTSTGYTFTNLSAGTGYTFSIKARNAQEVETAEITTSVTTPSGSSGGGDTGGGGGGGGNGSGGGGGSCTTDACKPPACDPAINPNCDLTKDGLVKITKIIGGPTVGLTNQRNVFVELLTTYADLVALKASDGAPSIDFSGASFETVKSAVAWNLAGVDGKKCVNARFANSAKGFTYDTYACTVLDTTPPVTPTFYITGVSSVGVVAGNVRLSNLAATEPNTRLTIVIKKADVNVGTFYTNTDNVGNWTFLLSGSLFTTGGYEFQASLTDLAGNLSNTASLSVTITKPCIGLACDGDPKCPIGTSGTYPQCTPNKPEGCPAGTSGPDCKPDKPKPACPTGTSGPNCTPNNDGPIGGDPIGDGPIGDGGTGGSGSDGGAGGGVPSGAGGTDGAGSSGGTGNGGGAGADGNSGTAGSSNGGSTAGSGGSGVGGSNETDVETTIPTNLVTVKPVTETRGPVVIVVEKAVDRAVEFVSDPQVQTVNQVAVAPVLVTAAVANALTGVGAASMFNFLHFVFAQPILALRRRNAKSWGVVYNAYSKLPVDLASVRLVDVASGRALQSQVTDLQGRYFMAMPDATKSYRLEVSKAGYKGIAQLHQTDDAPFLNLYHGTEFTAATEHPEIAYSIPLEPETGNLSALQIIRQKTKQTLHRAASSFGLVFSVFSFIVTPSILIGVFVALHAVVYAVFYIVGYKLKPDTWGVVRDKAEKTRLGRVVVRVFDAAYNKLVSTAVTDTNGRYAVLVGPSRFVVTYEKVGYDKAQSEPLDFGPDKTKGRGGIINRSEVLQKIN